MTPTWLYAFQSTFAESKIIQAALNESVHDPQWSAMHGAQQPPPAVDGASGIGKRTSPYHLTSTCGALALRSVVTPDMLQS